MQRVRHGGAVAVDGGIRKQLSQRDVAADVIEVPVALEGIPMLFVDTAGLRDSTDDETDPPPPSPAAQSDSSVDFRTGAPPLKRSRMHVRSSSK